MSIPFETSNKPWFGPRKRATELLVHRTTLLPASEAIEVFKEILGRTADRINRIRFIDYIHRSEQPFRYTIALCWMGADAKARDAVYDKSAEIVRATGWYPLPQGERISSRISEINFRRLGVSLAPKELQISLGRELRFLQSAVGQDGGCSIRVVTNNGSLLLDTGLPGALVTQPSDQLVLLSHGHLDHCGGIIGGECEDLPTIMSTATARLLTATERVPISWLSRQAMLLDAGRVLQVGRLSICPFSVPHCPGSVGYIISASNGVLIFSGDLAFKSARHDFVPTLTQILSKHSSDRCTVLLDATMVSRPHGVTKTGTATLLLGKLSEYEDIALVSNDVEQLLYANLDLFYTAKQALKTRSQIEFIATPALRAVFEVLHSAFISRQLDLLDPFVAAQYGQSMSAWAESRWLYWLGPHCKLEINSSYKRIWFVTKEEINQILLRGKLGLVPIGRLEGDPSVAVPNGEVLNLDSAVWTLHSDEATLYEAIQQIPPCNAIGLFHNFTKRLKKFTSLHGLPCFVLDENPFPFIPQS